MRIIFTRNSSILSWAIRWTFREPSSHVALVFDEDRWLVQSNLLGVNIRLFEPFMKKSGNEIVDSIEYSLTLDQEEELFQALLKRTSEQSYDWPGFAYFIFRGILYRMFGRPLPKKNAWGRADMQICTEMIREFPSWLVPGIDGVDLGITTPWTVRNILRGAK